MKDVRLWLSRRTPSPPPPLARWLEEVPLGDGSAPVEEALATGCLVELDRARSAPGRVRRSALHLLAADALLTYACEAALDEADPGASLEALVRRAAADRR